MSDWTDGYVTNTDYTSHFYPYLSPQAQNFAVLLSGAMPADIGGGYTYCELGCGQGYTTALLAAANPNGRFWGVDFNPSHIAGANKMQAAAGLANVTFLEKSFVELKDADLPPFDFISLHGIWSWISAANREALTAFIYAKLKPGGIVYISYNALPGWAAPAPLRQLMVESQRHKTDIDSAAVDDALGLIRRMKDMGAAFFKANPALASELDLFAKMPKNYIMHEYFNRDWTPFYFSDVAGEMRKAKLAFTCSSDVAEHLDQLCIGKDAREMLAGFADTTARETIRDYFRNRRFRRDLFTRGARKLSPDERITMLRGTRLALITLPPEFPLQVTFPVGAITIPAEPFSVITAMLAEKSCTLGTVMDDPRLVQLGYQGVFQAVLLLVAAGRAQAALPEAGEAERRQSTARFNAAMLASAVGREAQSLASPVMGNGITVSATEQFIMALERGGQQLTPDSLMRLLTAKNITLQPPPGGEAPADPAAAVAELLASYRRRQGLFQRLGVL